MPPVYVEGDDLPAGMHSRVGAPCACHHARLADLVQRAFQRALNRRLSIGLLTLEAVIIRAIVGDHGSDAHGTIPIFARVRREAAVGR